MPTSSLRNVGRFINLKYLSDNRVVAPRNFKIFIADWFTQVFSVPDTHLISILQSFECLLWAFLEVDFIILIFLTLQNLPYEPFIQFYFDLICLFLPFHRGISVYYRNNGFWFTLIFTEATSGRLHTHTVSLFLQIPFRPS